MAQSLNERVASEVRAEMGRQQLSVNELARRLGFSQPYLSRRMNGTVPLDLIDLEKIARELGVAVETLVAVPAVRAVS